MSFYSADLPYRIDAARYYSALADLPWAIWLDSGGMARYDIVTANPQRTLVLNGESSVGDPFTLLRNELGEQAEPVEDVPFAGGALGYWGYDLMSRTLGIPEVARNTGYLPDMTMGIYDWALVLDHQKRTARLVSHQRFAETAHLLPQILIRLRNSPALPPDDFRVHGEITSNFTRTSYAGAFASVQDYLKSGDCYQVNLAQRFSAVASGDALGAYLALRNLSPAPYSAFLNLPQAQILCASPERFLRVQQRRVETRPIKGTRPRGRDAHHDALLALELQNHPKDRAENLMIVDLLRNDLGKSCMPGSVRVPKLFEVESFAGVHHLVSTVEGELIEGRDALHVLCDCFPGGSVTGAPKLRAMQIIAQLEPDRRGIYCGTIGYVGFDGNMDSNIVIRTLVYSGDKIWCWAGGGIVADSEEKAEYQETLDKASAMLG
ncbi:MAG TPA: aminodeoxychorismate synthase component I, partial [Gallionella sp.]|nr:aminodeoxychorismate synthase component I [Gallionella sp.]